jgi:hypothetical protein
MFTVRLDYKARKVNTASKDKSGKLPKNAHFMGTSAFDTLARVAGLTGNTSAHAALNSPVQRISKNLPNKINNFPIHPHQTS